MTCIALTGCAANDLMLKRQTETEAKVEQLMQTGSIESLRINELTGQLRTQDDMSKASATQLNQLQETVRELRASQDELKARMMLLVQHSPAPKIEVVNHDATQKSRDTGPPVGYVKAFGLYSANNFADAIVAFDAFIKNSPKSDFVANALYWIGECHYSMAELPRAKTVFAQVAATYPNNAKAPDALLKLGYTLAAMKDTDKARATYESLIKQYPSSPAAVKARERLTAN
jgi:tol-pal system protein YbgF